MSIFHRAFVSDTVFWRFGQSLAGAGSAAAAWGGRNTTKMLPSRGKRNGMRMRPSGNVSAFATLRRVPVTGSQNSGTLPFTRNVRRPFPVPPDGATK